MAINANIDELFPSRWLKAIDLPENGTPKGFTVKDLNFEEVGQDRERKLVVYFTETTKGLILNKVNAQTLADLVGKDLNKVVGKKIGLFATPVSFGGKVSLGIRVWPKPIQAAPAAPAPVRQAAPPPPEPEYAEPDWAAGEGFSADTSEAKF